MKVVSKNSYDLSIATFAGLSTLIFYLPLSDAANIPKLIIYMGLATYISIYLLLCRALNLNKNKLLLLPMFFILITIFVWLIHPNLYLQAFGNPGRLIGFINYFCLAIILIGASYLKNTKIILDTLIFTGLAQSIYSLIQILNIDPISWNNPYGKAIGTLANADFLSAFIGMSTIAVTYRLFISGRKSIYFYLSVIIINFIALLGIGAYQGIVLSLIAPVFYYSFRIKNAYRKIYWASVAVFTSIAGLGVLGTGLFSFLYKLSVQLRGDYWRAAYDMIIDKPFLGYGFGNFQNFYREYRDLTAINRRGVAYVADSAHSIYLDLLVTGGFLLLIAFAMLFGTLIIKGIRKLIQDKDFYRSETSVFFLIVIAYLAQGFISMDALGMAIWGWISAGVLLAKFAKPKSHEKKISLQLNYSLVGFSLVAAFAISFGWLKADLDSKNLMTWYENAAASGGNVNTIQPIEDLSKSGSNIPTYLNEAGLAYIRLGDFDKAIVLLEKSSEILLRDYDSKFYLANVYEINKNLELAIKYRKQIITIDPLNLENRLALVKNYIEMGKRNLALEEQNAMKRIDPDSQFTKDAVGLLN